MNGFEALDRRKHYTHALTEALAKYDDADPVQRARTTSSEASRKFEDSTKPTEHGKNGVGRLIRFSSEDRNA